MAKKRIVIQYKQIPNFKNKINYIVLENEPDNLEKVYDDDTEDKKFKIYYECSKEKTITEMKYLKDLIKQVQRI